MYWFAGRDPALKDSPQILSRVEVWTLESPFHNLHVSSFIHSTTNFDACLESLSCWNTSYVQVSTVAVETWTQLSVSTGQWSLLELKNLSIIVINQKSLGLGFVKLKYIVEHWEPLIKRFNRVDLSWYVENFSLKKIIKSKNCHDIYAHDECMQTSDHRNDECDSSMSPKPEFFSWMFL